MIKFYILMEQFKCFYISNIYRVNSFCQAKPITLTNNGKNRTVYSLVYKTSGKTIYHYNNKEYVSDSEHIVFIAKNKPYVMDCIKTGTCIMIDFDLVNNIDTFYSFKINDTQKVYQTFLNLYKIWTNKNTNGITEILSLLYPTLQKVFALQDLSYSSKTKISKLTPAIEYIENNFTSPNISNEFLANLCNTSVVYFRKLFTQIYSVSPMKYVHDLKIEKAKDMLLGDYDSISTIAEEVGFCNIYSFSRSFKHATGLYPSEYLKRNKTH